MSTEDGSDRSHGGSRSAGGSGAAAGAIPDPLREVLLGLAAQIDQVAAWFAPGGARPGSAPGRDATDPTASETGAGGAPRPGGRADLAGEITTLLAEIGDLLARLIAALIAVLEAIAAALRATPAPESPPPAHYQSIAVRVDAEPPFGRPDQGGNPAADPTRPTTRRPEPEGEK